MRFISMINYKSVLIGFFLLFMLAEPIAAQNKLKVKNLPNYEKELLHFGFSIGVNRANYRIHFTDRLSAFDSLLYIHCEPQYGFNLAIISELRLHDFVTFRFLPALSFQERILNYSIAQGNDTLLYKKNVESTILEFPLGFKLRSARYNNIGCYLVGGLKYSYDLASQKDVKQAIQAKDIIVKVKKHDWSYEAGIGMDFYLPYFKFSAEVKGVWGLRDLLVKDNAVFSTAIDKLNSQVILISFHFEG